MTKLKDKKKTVQLTGMTINVSLDNKDWSAKWKHGHISKVDNLQSLEELRSWSRLQDSHRARLG
jgi:hypothetical protein